MPTIYLLIISLFIISCGPAPDKQEAEEIPEAIPEAQPDETQQTAEEEPDLDDQGEYLAELQRLKEKYIGHYHGVNEDDTSVYIELTPYVYKIYDFKGHMKIEDFRKPTIGTWGIKPSNPQLIHLDLRSPTSRLISEISIGINEDGTLTLLYAPDVIELESVGMNHVPMLYHFNRNVVEGKGSIISHNSAGILEIQHNFPDFKEIINQDATDITNLGFMYQTGQTYGNVSGTVTDESIVDSSDKGKIDYDKAAELYEEAAKMGYPPAMYNLACMYEDNDWAFEQDLPKCVQWLTAGSNLGHTASQQMLAEILYFGGEGIEVNKEQAIQLWKDAAEKGNRESQYYYGNVLLDKENATEEELKEGEMWIRSAAGRDHPDAFYSLFLLTDDKAMEHQSGALQEEAGFLLMQAYHLGSKYAKEFLDNIRQQAP